MAPKASTFMATSAYKKQLSPPCFPPKSLNHSLNSIKLVTLNAAMNPRIKGSLVIFFWLLMFLSAGIIKVSGIGVNSLHLHNKRGAQGNSRKLLGHDAELDYDDAGPNPRHDPRGRRRSGGRIP